MRTYLDGLTPAQKKKVAKTAKTTPEYLIQIAGGHRDASPKLAIRLENATDGEVSRADLRPDLWEAA